MLATPLTACQSAAMLRFAFALSLAATAASAETPMSAAEFEAHTRGKTVFYSVDGQDFGIEEYLDGRRVRWRFVGDACVEGHWYELGEMICFVYEGYADHQCWTFFRGAGGLKARFENDAQSRPVYETRESREPLICPGPKAGV